METGEELEGGAGRGNDTNMGLRRNFQEINFKKNKTSIHVCFKVKH